MLLATAAALTGGCATNEAIRYAPSLSSLAIPLGERGATVTALVSVVAPPAAEREMPAGIEVRLRLDNHGKQSATLAPDSLEVVTADLESLGHPELIPAGPVVVPPGGEATVSAMFAIPRELGRSAEPLRALNVHFTVQVGDRSYVSSVTFDRVERERLRYAQYEYGYWPYAGFAPTTVIVVHHRHGA